MKLGSQREHTITAVLSSCNELSQVCKQAWHGMQGTCTCGCVLEFTFCLVGAFWRHFAARGRSTCMQRVAYSGENSRLSPLLSLSHSPEDVSRFFDTWAFTQCAIRNGFLLPVIIYYDA